MLFLGTFPSFPRRGGAPFIRWSRSLSGRDGVVSNLQKTRSASRFVDNHPDN